MAEYKQCTPEYRGANYSVGVGARGCGRGVLDNGYKSQRTNECAVSATCKLTLPIDFTGRSEELLVILISVDRN